MFMNWPQLVYIAWLALNLGSAIYRNIDKPMYRMNAAVLVNLISAAIATWVLYCGGFFTVVQPPC